MSPTALTVELPPGLRSAIERLARESGVTPEQFLASAAAEKVGVLTDQDRYLAERAARGDLEWFDRFMTRKGGGPSTSEDTLQPTVLPDRSSSA